LPSAAEASALPHWRGRRPRRLQRSDSTPRNRLVLCRNVHLHYSLIVRLRLRQLLLQVEHQSDGGLRGTVIRAALHVAGAWAGGRQTRSQRDLRPEPGEACGVACGAANPGRSRLSGGLQPPIGRWPPRRSMGVPGRSRLDQSNSSNGRVSPLASSSRASRAMRWIISRFSTKSFFPGILVGERNKDLGCYRILLTARPFGALEKRPTFRPPKLTQAACKGTINTWAACQFG
jgi:hypothetical protein